MAKTKSESLLRMSRITPKREDSEMDSVAHSIKSFGNGRAFDILMEAQHYWMQMESFRRARERNKRYTYGDQWGDMVCVDKLGTMMTEENYIRSQGQVPLKNNLIRRLVRNVIGVYRSQSKEPVCKARVRDEQKLGETMSVILQYNMQLNRMSDVYARGMEEFLISGFVVNKVTYGWRRGKLDCWTDFVPLNNFFIDNNMRDLRGWDASFIGEIHDCSLGEVCEQFAKSPEDYARLANIYAMAKDRGFIASYVSEFGYSRQGGYDFLYTGDPGRCRVIEVWRKELKPRFRCHDYQNGEVFKIEIGDYQESVEKVNLERLQMAREAGMPEEEVPLIKAEWFMDNYWYYYFLSPFGDILQEGESPYEHGEHPYVFKGIPFIDKEIHSFVSDVIDQQKYVNRLITLYDWIMRASAKGVLMVPKDCLDGVSPEEFADAWTEFNGVIVYKPSKSGQVPHQVAVNSTNIGISEVLNLQLKFFEDISGVNGALQGKPGFSGQSAAMYNQQTQNSTMALLDILETFGSFVVDGAYKNVKNIQQFYDDKKVFNIAGYNGVQIEYNPNKIRDVEYDISIMESTSTPAYRMLANDILLELFRAQAISVEQLLQNGDFPFSDELLQSIQSQKEQIQQGQIPQGVSPQLMQQARQGADMRSVNRAYNALRN